MILVYSDKITSRLRYIVRFIFTDILQVPVSITDSSDDFKSFEGPKINYSFNQQDGISITPANLLFNNTIEYFEVEVVWHSGIPLLFHVCGDVPLPFDPLAASFYMVSRYEEYVSQQRDGHGRFLASYSLAGKFNFISVPVVDKWAYMLRNEIQKQYPKFQFPKRNFNFVPTIDVDSISLFKGKPLLRQLGATLKSVFRGDFNDLNARLGTLLFKKQDPLDTFDLLDSWHQKFNIRPVYFFLVGDHSRFDGNLPISGKKMQSCIKRVASKYTVGLHPSYYTHLDKQKVQIEKDALELVLEKKINLSRQHYLRFQLPGTYKNLIETGITEDYSMGFPDQPGFRAGTCTPFNFFDLTSNSETPLKVVPLTLMDASLLRYMHKSPETSIKIVQEFIDTVKEVNGTFILLWHNSFIMDGWVTRGWENVYPRVLELFNRL